MKRSTLKERLFNLYSQNFIDVISETNAKIQQEIKVYYCPLCKNGFKIDQLDPTGDNYLTIEHILPSSVAGNEVVLTCKQCNNQHGSKLDSHLKKKLETSNFFGRLSGAEKNTSFRIDDRVEADGKIHIDKNGLLNFFFDGTRTNPVYHDYLKRLAVGEFDKANVNFTFPTFDNNKFRASLLRSAHLKAFKELGYIYLLNINSEIPRKAVIEFDLQSEALDGVFQIKDNLLPSGIYIIRNPDGLQGYLVSFNLKLGNKSEHYCIILPGPTMMSKSIYRALKDYKNIQISMDLLSLESIDLLSNQNGYFVHQLFQPPKE